MSMDLTGEVQYITGYVEAININVEKGVQYTNEQLIQHLIRIEEMLLEAQGEEKYRP